MRSGIKVELAAAAASDDRFMVKLLLCLQNSSGVGGGRFDLFWHNDSLDFCQPFSCQSAQGGHEIRFQKPKVNSFHGCLRSDATGLAFPISPEPA